MSTQKKSNMSITKLRKEKKIFVTGKIEVSNKVQDYSNHPLFVKRAKAAEELLKKMWLPKGA